MDNLNEKTLQDDRKAIAISVTNNTVLPDPILSTARALLSQTETALALANTEIERLQSEPVPIRITRTHALTLLDQLHEQRRVCKSLIGKYRIAIAPHRKIPNEILWEVFHLCGNEEIRVPWQFDAIPWVLSRVCSKWRRISFGLPILWQDIRFSSQATGDSRLIRMADEILSRDNTSLHSFRADVTHSADPRELVDFILAHTARWESLYILGRSAWLVPLLSLPHQKFPVLRSFTIDPIGTFTIQNMSLLTNARALRDVSIPVGIIDVSVSLFQMPLSNLTSLTMPGTTLQPNAALAIMSQSTSLISCILGLRFTPNPVSDPYVTNLLAGHKGGHILPALKILRLWVHGPVHYILWIRQLIMPSLTEFTIGIRTWSWDWPPECTPTIVYSRRLEKLVMTMGSMSSDGLESLLEGAPCLMELRVPKTQPLSSAMLQKIERGEILPRLSVLVCSVNTLVAFEEHLNMIEARRRNLEHGKGKIVEVVLYNRTPQRLYQLPGVMQRAKELRDHGLDIVLKEV